MLPAWLELLTARPQLMVEHGQAYVQLLGEESGQALARWRRQLLLHLVTGLCAVLTLMLAGMAGLLAAALPVNGMPMPWLLVALPLIPLLIGLISWSAGRREQDQSFVGLKQQLRADAEFLQEMMIGTQPGEAP